ncbi:MAG: geranylgeranylglyceryl/heptaprenylglyceryl phosphate synthase [Flavobacteriales bacterium]|jgi:putative glycerol-1-phosphate prenyltransferase|nr:geranylgeranylglyceryl/heptaprenylglyceryl phosphate synthase [Flavobacteriales bacterium]MDP7430156.1 geranylgeranylglyceryl/heptaprenylglyceryl phosphate synthase [Flavobacteriales bacterium]HJN64553.1 geranylgeranylglyceryl/heptaprenylglyceryl phosphate synthase [Flavobacteriales bacterium]
MSIYNNIITNKKANKKSFALLIDPDKQEKSQLITIIEKAKNANTDYFFVGGSLLTNDSLDICLETLKAHSDIPVVLFPGNAMQVNNKADAILFLSLISGRNAEMLIGKQVITAPILKQSSLEVLPTGYMLIDSGKPTTVSYMSNTTPIPAKKDAVAACTAMAGEMLGLKLIFMDGGSGAKNPISEKMIAEVSKSIDIPLIIGGGISSGEKAIANCKAGADIIVVGNAIEKDESLIAEISNAMHNC